ncbi:MAG: hypothetical protein M3Q47_15205 [Actinomycetota bacterium]|nr:hypothetical protein [Actinomycetota bacterium]
MNNHHGQEHRPRLSPWRSDGRSQTRMPGGTWVKRDTRTGQFLDRKADSAPFKGVRREK